jgi:hypothetical protein
MFCMHNGEFHEFFFQVLSTGTVNLPNPWGKKIENKFSWYL